MCKGMKNRLKQLRKERGWSQQQLAMKSEIGKTTISAIEVGKTLNPSVDIAYKISKALGVSIEMIFYALDEY